MYTICPKCQFRTAQNKKMCGACGFVREQNVANPLQDLYENQPATSDIDWAAAQRIARSVAQNLVKKAGELVRAMRKRAAEVLADLPVDRR